MSRRFLFALLIGVELLMLGGVLAWKFTRPMPPVPNLSRMDEETARDLKSLREQAGQSPEAWRELAEAYLAFGYFPEAEACYAQAAAWKPGQFATEYGWAYTLQRLGRLDSAVERFQAAAELAPREMVATCWYHLGRCQLRRENVLGALEAFQRIDGFPPADFLRVRILLRGDRLDEAVALLDRMQKESPMQIQPWLLRSYVASALGDENAAREARELSDQAFESLKLSDHNEFLGPIRARYGLTKTVYAAARDRSEGHDRLAMESLQEALPLADLSNRVKMVSALAELKVENRQPEEAITLLKSLHESISPLPETLMILGDALAQTVRQQDSTQQWQRALDLRPSAAIYERLAEVSRRQGDEAHARTHSARAACYRGIDAFRQNQLPTAAQHLEDATKLDPDDARAWFYLAESYRFMKQANAARNAYERCLALDFAHGRAQDGLAAIDRL